MLFETSKARITVPCRCGSARLTVGRASAKQTSASAAAKSANGTWRRQRTRRPAVVGTSPSDASRAARSARARIAPRVREHQHGNAGEAEQHPRRPERHQRRRHLRDSTIRTSARTRSSAVDTSQMSTPARSGERAQLRLAVLAGLAQAAAELGVARVDDELLSGLGVLDDDHAGVGKLVLARIEQPDRDDLVALGQPEQRPLPAGRGDEVGDEDDERPPPDRAVRGLEQAREVGDRPVRPRAAAAGSGRARAPGCGRCAAGSSPRSRCRRGSRPTRLPPRVSRRASVVASSLSTSSFGRSIGPKPIDGDRSRRSHAVSSRSSMYCRTNGVSIRAVTFQSMWRTSSPGSYSRRSRKSVPIPRYDGAVAPLQHARRAGGSRATRGGAGAARASRRRACGSAPSSLGSGAAAGHPLPERELGNGHGLRGCGR